MNAADAASSNNRAAKGMKKGDVMKRLIHVFGMMGVMAAAVLLASAGPAAAVPVIDGATTFSPEWDGFFIQAFDVAEAGIADAYDIDQFRLLNDAGGIYMLLTTFGAPTLADQDAGATSNTALVELVFDYDGNGLLTDAADRRLLHTANTAGTSQTMTWKDGTGALLFTGVEGTNFKLGSVYEYFVPLASDAGVIAPNTIRGFAFLDNGGGDADDHLPDAGFFLPVPEPGSLSLMGLGLLSFFGAYRGRRRV